MPQLGVFVAIAVLMLIALLSLGFGLVYFRATGAEAQRRSRVRAAVQAQRRSRQRPPLLSQGEVPEDPAELLRSQNSWRHRLRRRR